MPIMEKDLPAHTESQLYGIAIDKDDGERKNHWAAKWFETVI